MTYAKLWFYRSIGLKKVKDHKDHGEVYWYKVKEILKEPVCQNFEYLRKLYSESRIDGCYF